MSFIAYAILYYRGDVAIKEVEEESISDRYNKLNHFIGFISLCSDENIPDYYDNDEDLPVYERLSSKSKRLYSPEQLLKILLNSNLQSSNVLCGKVPTSVSSSVVFVVDVNKLGDPNDLLCDDMGVWRNNGVDSAGYLVSLSNGQVSTVEKSFSSDEATYMLKRVYRVHGSNPGLKKLTVYIYGMWECFKLIMSYW